MRAAGYFRVPRRWPDLVEASRPLGRHQAVSQCGIHLGALLGVLPPLKKPGQHSHNVSINESHPLATGDGGHGIACVWPDACKSKCWPNVDIS